MLKELKLNMAKPEVTVMRQLHVMELSYASGPSEILPLLPEFTAVPVHLKVGAGSCGTSSWVYLPDGHREHACMLAAENLPAGQTEQLVLPVLSAKVPSVHAEQLPSPSASLAVN
jgi:hypothetical protein